MVADPELLKAWIPKLILAVLTVPSALISPNGLLLERLKVLTELRTNAVDASCVVLVPGAAVGTVGIAFVLFRISHDDADADHLRKVRISGEILLG